MEAIVGFILLSGAVTWVLPIQPIISRKTTFARELTQLFELRGIHELLHSSPIEFSILLQELTAQCRTIHADLSHFPITYYFRGHDERYALAAAMPYADRLASVARESQDSALSLYGDLFEASLDDLAGLIASHFLHRSYDSQDAIFAAFAADHLVDLSRFSPVAID